MISVAFMAGCLFMLALHRHKERQPFRTTHIRYTDHYGYSVSNDFGHVRTVRASK